MTKGFDIYMLPTNIMLQVLIITFYRRLTLLTHDHTNAIWNKEAPLKVSLFAS